MYICHVCKHPHSTWTHHAHVHTCALKKERNRVSFLNVCCKNVHAMNSQPYEPRLITLGLGIIWKAGGNSKETERCLVLYSFDTILPITMVEQESDFYLNRALKSSICFPFGKSLPTPAPMKLVPWKLLTGECGICCKVLSGWAQWTQCQALSQETLG